MKASKDDPRSPNFDKQNNKDIYIPNQKPRQPGFDDNDGESDKRHPHQEGPMPSG